LTGWDHCRQSIADIVTTAIGARVIARAYGSNVPALIDRPQNPATLIAHYAAIAGALRKWEPGFKLTSVQATQLGADGVAGISAVGVFYPNGHLGDYTLAIPNLDAFVALPIGALS